MRLVDESIPAPAAGVKLRAGRRLDARSQFGASLPPSRLYGYSDVASRRPFKLLADKLSGSSIRQSDRAELDRRRLQWVEMRRPDVAGSPERRDSIVWLCAARNRRSLDGDIWLNVDAFESFDRLVVGYPLRLLNVSHVRAGPDLGRLKQGKSRKKAGNGPLEMTKPAGDGLSHHESRCLLGRFSTDFVDSQVQTPTGNVCRIAFTIPSRTSSARQMRHHSVTIVSHTLVPLLRIRSPTKVGQR